METISLKQRFLEDNMQYKEIKASAELTTIGKFQDIDEIEDEVWVLQCPKGFNLEEELQSQKLKLPGRTNFNSAEAVSVEYAEPETRAFGYCNRKGRYSLRLLPVKGSILLRNRLKVTEGVTLESAEALCPPPSRVPFPDMIKVRHPLHGHQFDKSLRINKSIAERLKKADEISAKLTYEAVTNRTSVKSQNSKLSSQKKKSKTILATNGKNLSDDDDVEFIGEVTPKKKENKRKRKDSKILEEEKGAQLTVGIAKKKKKSDKVEEVAKDLQWLQNI
uniref:Methionyl-tRNA formyltransferase n=1 Tax=Zeugodacus cucurbitae TaxID=28588 RepID=A0A0A1WV49_ZEUCU